MTLTDSIPSRSIRIFLYILGGLIIFLLILKIGILVGYHRAYFGQERYGWHGMHSSRGPQWMPPPAFLGGGHGAVGVISNLTQNTFTLTGRDGEVRTVHLATTTQVRGTSASAASTALAKGTFIIVIGTPETDGSVEAKLIRILPAPPAAASPTQN